jgi:thioredoxin reductase (NADPH)
MGPDLMNKMRMHARSCGAEFISDKVVTIDATRRPFMVTTASGKKLASDAIIVTTGAVHKRLGIPGEQELWGRGVSVCATCDAPFMKGKEVVVIGGGNTALTEAEHLAHFAERVTIVHRRNEFSTRDPLVKKVLANPRIRIMYDTIAHHIKGEQGVVTGAVLENTRSHERTTIACSGVFIAIGLTPATDFLRGVVDLMPSGHVITEGKSTRTSVNGIFAAGDVADDIYRQAITSAGEGCKAALDVEKYLTGSVSSDYAH